MSAAATVSPAQASSARPSTDNRIVRPRATAAMRMAATGESAAGVLYRTTRLYTVDRQTVQRLAANAPLAVRPPDGRMRTMLKKLISAAFGAIALVARSPGLFPPVRSMTS